MTRRKTETLGNAQESFLWKLSVTPNANAT